MKNIAPARPSQGIISQIQLRGGPAWKEIVSDLEIIDKHCDELGHLNHVEAVRILEYAREDWFNACGLYDDCPPGVFLRSPVVVNINYNYRLEVFKGETVKVVTRSGSKGTKSFILEHEILKSNGDVAINGNCTSVIMDMAERGIVPVPDSMAPHLPNR